MVEHSPSRVRKRMNLYLMGRRMYEKPALQRFGTIRELTRLGTVGGNDGAVFWGDPTDTPDGDNLWSRS